MDRPDENAADQAAADAAKKVAAQKDQEINLLKA